MQKQQFIYTKWQDRKKNKNLGKFTFRDTSILDYAVSNADGLEFVHDFEILDMDALFTDGHSLLSMSLKLQTVKHNGCSKNLNDPSSYTHWQNEKMDTFVSDIDPAKIDVVTETLRQMKRSDLPINKSSINDTIDKISSIFADSALKSFRQKQKFSHRSNIDKARFGQDCKTAKHEYENAKSRHRKNPTTVNKTLVQDKSKNYKKTMNKYINKHSENTKRNIRNLNKNNPKDFWKIINSLDPQNTNQALDINEFYSYFERQWLAVRPRTTSLYRLAVRPRTASQSYVVCLAVRLF